MARILSLLALIMLWASLACAQSTLGNTMSASDTGRPTLSIKDDWLFNAATNPLPSCNPAKGRVSRAYVSDQTDTTCTNNVPYVSGGTQGCEVVCLNSALGWRIIGSATSSGGGGALRTVYVNNTASCPGTGTASAQYCTIQNALTNALAGDDIRIQKTGTNYNENNSLTVSGTAAHPITIEADNPSNQPILTNTVNTADGSIQMALNAVNYITVQNLKWDGTGLNVAMVALEVIDGSISPVGIQVLNNTFTNWGASNTTVDYGGENNASIWFHVVTTGHNISGLIQGNTITGTRYTAIQLWSPTNVSIINNTITGSVCGISNGAAGHANAELGREEIRTIQFTAHLNTNIVIQGNTIANATATCALTSQGPYSYSEWSGIHNDGGDSNGVYTQNTIHDLAANAIGTNGQNGIHLEFGAQGNLVASNLIYNMSGGSGSRGIYSGSASSGTQNIIAGNTVYGVGYVGLACYADCLYKDNILLNNGIQIHCDQSPCVNFTSDYNSLWDFSGGNNVGNLAGGGTLNFASWKSTTSQDAHSLNADPTLTSPSTGNFLQQATSNTRGAGISVSQLTSDYLGVTRPSPPSMGAYEFPN